MIQVIWWGRRQNRINIFTLCFLLRFLMTALHLLVALIERPWSFCREDKLVSVTSSCLPVAFRMQSQGSASTSCAKIKIQQQQQKNNTKQLRKCTRSHTLYTLTHTHTSPLPAFGCPHIYHSQQQVNFMHSSFWDWQLPKKKMVLSSQMMKTSEKECFFNLMPNTFKLTGEHDNETLCSFCLVVE